MTKPEIRLGWYPHDVDRWRGDERVQMLTYAERGLYRDLLDHQWIEGSIPSDDDQFERLFFRPKVDVMALWAVVCQFFDPVDSDPTRLQNHVLEEIRDQQLAKFEQHSNAGTLGAEARWGKKKKKTKKRSKAKAGTPNPELADGLRALSGNAVAHAIKSDDDAANGSAIDPPVAEPMATEGEGGKGGTIGGEGREGAESPSPSLSPGESEGGKPSRTTQLTPFCDVWREAYGGELIPKGSKRGGEVGKVVKGVVDAIQEHEKVADPWIEALARFTRWVKTTKAEFANIHKWARTHGTYRSKGGTRISRASKLTVEGAPDG